MSTGTIEDKALELKARKQELVASVLHGDGTGAPASLDGDDLRAVRALRRDRRHGSVRLPLTVVFVFRRR